MKITTTAEAFVSALKASVRPEKKVNIPVLQNVKLEHNQVVSTDLDLSSIVDYEAVTVSKGGAFLVPYYPALSVLEGETGPLTIELTPAAKKEKDSFGVVKFSLGSCEYKFDSVSVTNFPQIPSPAKATLTVPGKDFRQLLDRVIPAISTEESRYTLCGALLKAGQKKVTMVGTDGHRLSCATSPNETELAQTLVSLPALEWLKKQTTGVPVEIGVDGDYQTFRMGNKTLISRKITGQFPDYNAIFPTNNTIVAAIPSCAALAKVLAKVAKCAEDRNSAVVWELDGMLELSARCQDRGESYALYECAVSGWKEAGDRLKIGLNAEYILEFLKVAGDVPVNIAFRDSRSSVLFALDGWQYVVMPMRV